MNRKLLHKFANNRCSSDEVDEVLNWIQKTDQQSAKVMFQEYWDKTKPTKNIDDTFAQQRLDKIHHRININHSDKIASEKIRTLPSKKIFVLQSLARVAVILLIPVLTLFVYTRFFQQNFIADNEIISPPASRTFLELSDGTKVWLNHGSKMVYPQTFAGSTRHVKLSGEAYFEVAHNPSKPFIVESEGMQVKAVGTAFNVRAYDDGSDFETTLEEGKVLVQSNLNGNATTVCNMDPGQHFTLNLKTKVYNLKSEESYKFVAWKDGKLIFDNDHLDKVAQRLSEWYNVDVILEDPKLAELTYNATFVDENISQILNMMKIVMPVTFVEQKREKAPDGTYKKQQILLYLKN